jgi:hypothetical protein
MPNTNTQQPAKQASMGGKLLHAKEVSGRAFGSQDVSPVKP